MPWELQHLVDSLARRLERSVAIDDRHIRLLAYTPHRSKVDQARLQSIMQRTVSSELVRYVTGFYTNESDPFIVPAKPSLGLSIERIAFPIRHENMPLGFVWLLASEGPVTPEQAAATRECAKSAGQILHHGHLLGELSRGRKRELMRDLLSDQANVRREAAEKLIEEELSSPDRSPPSSSRYPIRKAARSPKTSGWRSSTAWSMRGGRYPSVHPFSWYVPTTAFLPSSVPAPHRISTTSPANFTRTSCPNSAYRPATVRSE